MFGKDKSHRLESLGVQLKGEICSFHGKDDQALINELYPNDDLVGEKLPFVVLDGVPETTDDNTMLITDYIGEKRWQIA